MSRIAKVVAFSTTPQMAEEIDRLAAEEGRTRSELLREAVRMYSTARAGGASLAAEAPAVYATPAATTPSLPGLARVLERRAAIADACREAGAARLWVFGSAVRDDFDPAGSDFDFLVEFRKDARRKPFAGELFELHRALADVMGGPVDLGQAGTITNPYVLSSVDEEKLLIYGEE